MVFTVIAFLPESDNDNVSVCPAHSTHKSNYIGGNCKVSAGKRNECLSKGILIKKIALTFNKTNLEFASR